MSFKNILPASTFEQLQILLIIYIFIANIWQHYKNLYIHSFILIIIIMFHNVTFYCIFEQIKALMHLIKFFGVHKRLIPNLSMVLIVLALFGVHYIYTPRMIRPAYTHQEMVDIVISLTIWPSTDMWCWSWLPYRGFISHECCFSFLIASLWPNFQVSSSLPVKIPKWTPSIPVSTRWCSMKYDVKMSQCFEHIFSSYLD